MPGGRVEVAGRLVGEDTRGSTDERAGDRDPLLLAAGELRRAGARRARRGRPRRAARAHARAARPRAAGVSADLDVLERRQRRDQVELLEDEAERAQPQLGELAVAQRRRGRVPRRRRVPELGRSSAPSSCSSVVLPEPLGPSSATNSPASISRSMPSSARITFGPAREELRAPRRRQLELRHHSTCLSASAGRRRAARKRAGGARDQAAERARARTRAASTDAASGASSETWSRRRARRSRAEAEQVVRRRGRRARRQRRAERVDRERGEHAEHDAEQRRRRRPARATRRRPGGRPATASSRAPSASRARARACRPTRASGAPRAGTRQPPRRSRARSRGCARGSPRRRASR